MSIRYLQYCLLHDYTFLLSVQFNLSVMSDSLRPHGLQHTRLPCPSPSPGICSSSCPLSWWCHPTISSSVVPFSSCLQSFPASGSFPVSWLFISGGQSIGALASTSVPPMNIHGWFPLGLTGLIFLQSKALSRVFPQYHNSKASIPRFSVFFIVQLSHPFIATGKKKHSFDFVKPWTFVGKVISLLFNILSRFVIAILPRSKCVLILWLQSLSTLILEPKKMKYDTLSTFSPSFAMNG